MRLHGVGVRHVGAQQLSIKLGFISLFQFGQALIAGNLKNAFRFFEQVN